MLHCPRCGQQQVSEETKFCSRCGMPLGIVSEVVAQGGYLSQLAELQTVQKKSHFNKKNGVMFSVFWFIFFVPFLTWIFGGVFDFEVLAGILALTGVFGALMILIASLVYLPSSKVKPLFRQFDLPPHMAHGLHGQGQQPALPPQQSQPVSSYVPAAGGWRAPETGEFAHPGSVTDTTTKLLKHDE